MNIRKWLVRPRTIGSAITRSHCVLDEVQLLDKEYQKKTDNALSIAVGKEWKRVPTRSMMALVNLRYGTKPRDYSNDEVAKVLRTLVDLVESMSDDQVRFLSKFDHLPKTQRNTGGPWMDGDELASYAKAEDDIYHHKTQYFLMCNGILQAAEQSVGSAIKPKKEFKMSPIYIVVLMAVAAAAVLILM